MTERLQVCLSRAVRGDAKAAYMASHLLAREGGTPEMIQTQLRRSAEGGYTVAQRELAVLGIFGRLNESGKTKRCSSEDTLEQGMYWLSTAAELKDVTAMAVMSKCYQYGLFGTKPNKKKADDLMNECISFATQDELMNNIMVIALFDCFERKNNHEDSNCSWEYTDLLERLAG